MFKLRMIDDKDRRSYTPLPDQMHLWLVDPRMDYWNYTASEAFEFKTQELALEMLQGLHDNMHTNPGDVFEILKGKTVVLKISSQQLKATVDANGKVVIKSKATLVAALARYGLKMVVGDDIEPEVTALSLSKAEEIRKVVQAAMASGLCRVLTSEEQAERMPKRVRKHRQVIGTVQVMQLDVRPGCEKFVKNHVKKMMKPVKPTSSLSSLSSSSSVSTSEDRLARREKYNEMMDQEAV